MDEDEDKNKEKEGGVRERVKVIKNVDGGVS